MCGAIPALVAQFLVQQPALGALLLRARNGVLGVLQSDIAPLFTRRIKSRSPGSCASNENRGSP